MATVKDQQEIVRKLHWQFIHRQRQKTGLRELQAKTAVRAPPRKGTWISQDVFSAPRNSNLRDVFYHAVETASLTDDIVLPPRYSVILSDVPVEWIGQQKDNTTSPSKLSHSETYQRLCADSNQEMTILYAHGGAFYVGSPTYSRPSTTKLARLTKSRIVAVTYRLAPQHPFPAAILDLLIAWMSLVYPADNARHTAVTPKSVILAGDSAGGGLCLGMIQAILRIYAINGHEVLYNGKTVKIPLPAGMTVLSPSADMSLSMPSWTSNGKIDFMGTITPAVKPDQVADEIWPTDPPRGDPYCHQSAWNHPFVSPAIADSESWEGCPPLWIAIGEERCADGVKMVASQAARGGVAVHFSEYLGMPHIFPMMLGMLPQSKRCYEDWATTCLEFIRKGRRAATSSCKQIHMPGRKEKAISFDGLAPMTLEEAKRLVMESSRQRKNWTGQNTKL